MFTRNFYDTIIEYEIFIGNNQILFIKPGQNGSLRGYQNKYFRLAEYVNKKYGYTVICSSNPYDKKHNPIDDALEVIKQYVSEMGFIDYEVYYLGNSMGGLIGARWGYQYPQIKKMLLINSPLMVNFDKIKEGLNKFEGDKLVLIYGSLDPSMSIVRLFTTMENPKVSYYIIEGEDHNFSRNICSLEKLVDDYLFNNEVE